MSCRSILVFEMQLTSPAVCCRGCRRIFLLTARLRGLLFSMALMAILADSAVGAAYYVDYIGGSDSNDGLSTSSPFKHCPGDGNGSRCVNRCQAVALVAGDVVYFKRGVIYRGQIEATRKGAEVTYGSNAAVSAVGVFTASGQNYSSTVRAGDLVYVYNSSTTGAWIASVGIWSVASVDSDTQLSLIGFNKAAHPVAELTYRIWRPVLYTSTASWGSGDAAISGHDDSDTPAYYYMVHAAANYLKFSNLTFQDEEMPVGYPGSSCTTGTAVTAVFYGWYANNVGLIIDTCKFKNDWRIDNASYTTYNVIINNTATNVGPCGFEDVANYSLVENNTISNSGSGIKGIGSYDVIRGNVLTNVTESASVMCGFHSDGMMAFGGAAYTWIIGNYLANTLEGIYLSTTNGGTSHFTIVNNIFYGDYVTGSGDFAIYANLAPYTRIYNNTIVSYGTGGFLKGICVGSCDGSSYPSPNSEIINNIIYAPMTNAYAWIGFGDSASQVGSISDYNVIYEPYPANKTFRLAGAAATWSQWQAAGFDVHGSISKPSFISTGANFTDYDVHLKPSDGVARDKGTPGLLPFDFGNNPRPRGAAWDVGACEVQTPVGAPQNLKIISK